MTEPPFEPCMTHQSAYRPVFAYIGCVVDLRMNRLIQCSPLVLSDFEFCREQRPLLMPLGMTNRDREKLLGVLAP